MLVPVYEPPAQVDSSNIARFRSRVTELTERYGAIVVDCSQVDVIGPSGMRVLRLASRDANVTLVNPSRSLQLMAAAYGFDTDRTVAAGAANPQMRLLPVPDGRPPRG